MTDHEEYYSPDGAWEAAGADELVSGGFGIFRCTIFTYLAMSVSPGDAEKEIQNQQISRMRRFSNAGDLGLTPLFAGELLAVFPGWDPRWPPPDRMLIRKWSAISK